MSAPARIRIDLARREVEIEGDESFVLRYAEQIELLFSRLEEETAAPASTGAPPPERAQPPDLGSLGSFLHHLPGTATEVDKVLAAGFFLQLTSSDEAFGTAEANKRLAELGIKIGNPSQAVRQSIVAKRAFVVARGRYRVSQGGRSYLRQLMGSIIPA